MSRRNEPQQQGEVKVLQLPMFRSSPTWQRFHFSNSRVKCIRGPFGGGKSSMCVMEIVMRAFDQKPASDGIRYTRTLAIRNTFPMLCQSTMESWKEWMPEEVHGHKWCPIQRPMNSNPTGHMRVPWMNFLTGEQDGTMVDHEIIFISMDSSDDVGKLQGVPATFIWFNEISTMPEQGKEIFEMASRVLYRYPKGILGDPTYSCIIGDLNPCDTEHWYYKMAEKSPVMGWDFLSQPPSVRLKAGMKHGEGVVDSSKGLYGAYELHPECENVAAFDKKMEQQYGPNQGGRYWLEMTLGKEESWIRVFLMNQYGSVRRNVPVFRRYDDDLNYMKNPILPIRNEPLLIGVDFGATPSFAFGQHISGGQLRFLNEITTGFSGATLEEPTNLRAAINDLLKPTLTRIYPGMRYIFIADPFGGAQGAQTDGQTCNEILMQEFGADSVIPHIKYTWQARIDAMNYFLGRMVDKKVPALLVGSDCSWIREAMVGGYCYPKMSTADKGQAVPDKNSKFSHIMDAAMQVAVYCHIGGSPMGYEKQASARVGMADGYHKARFG